MSSLSDKLSSFSIYDVRKAARKAQNSIFASNSSIELMIRNATTTDSWGPSTKQLDEIFQQLQYEDPDLVFDIIFNRINEYLGSKNYKKQSYYNRAVHYVNSGLEWRIISKNLRIVEYIILHSQNDEYLDSVDDHKSILNKVINRFKYDVEVPNPSNITTAELEKKEHALVVTNIANEVVKLLNDDEYRSAQCLKAKRTSNLGSVKNEAVIFPNKVDQVSGFKTKHMNSSKVQNSNTKDEIKNQVGHVLHSKKRLPGRYSNFAQVESELYDDAEPYDYNKGFKDDEESEKEVGDLKEDEQSEEEEFGDFQTEATSSPIASRHEELLSFDDNLPEPYTPTTTTTASFDPYLTVLNSPVTNSASTNSTTTTQRSKNDTFADLFNNAKSSH